MTDPIYALITFALVATASPGGATSLATASGARFGYIKSLPLIAGIATTLALLVATSGTGLSAVILAFPVLELGMKAIGSAYLLWLAFAILRTGPPDEVETSGAKPIGFVSGSLLLLINPKAWAMAVGVAGSFSEISDSPLSLALIFGSVFAVAATLSLSFWALTGSLLAQLLSANWQWHVSNLAMAILLVLSIAAFWI